MGLLDADRFEGRFREGVHKADVSDMMRRLTKEELYRFDGTPLFPERRAYTASYELSPAEADLYQAVTTYVREEMNRADRTGDDKRRNNVGFALQILQRRLASSPAAIHRSLERRRKRLEERLREERLMRQGGSAPLGPSACAADHRPRRPRRGPGRRGGGGRGADPRSGHGRADPGRARGRDRHPQGPGGPRAAPEALGPGRQVAPARVDPRRADDARPGDRPAPQDPDLHRAQGHAGIPGAARSRPGSATPPRSS